MATIFLILFALVSAAITGMYFLIPGIILLVIVVAFGVFIIHQNRCRLFAHNPRAPQWLRASCADYVLGEKIQAGLVDPDLP
jgi:uncharacterized membrane protein